MIKSSLRPDFYPIRLFFLYLCEPNLTIIYHVEIIFQWIHKLFSVHVDIHKARVPVCKYFFCLQIMMNGNKPLDWLGDVWFMEGQQIRFLWKQTSKQTNKQKNQHSAARNQLWQHDGQEEEANKHSAKKDIDRFRLSFNRGIIVCTNFLFTCNAICVHNRAHNLWRPGSYQILDPS